MTGSPQPRHLSPLQAKPDELMLGSGSYPHYVPKSKLIFSPERGGWVMPDKHRAGQERAKPTHMEAGIDPADLPQGKREPTHFEQRHFGDWGLNLKKEIGLGLAPSDWSVSSAMDDPRPNGQALFDARFHGQSMGRARGGYSMIADSRGMEFTAGKLEKAANMDSDFFAEDMSDETALAKVSAEKNKFGNNTNMEVFQSNDLAMAGMSALQRARDTSKIDFD